MTWICYFELKDVLYVNTFSIYGVNVWKLSEGLIRFEGNFRFGIHSIMYGGGLWRKIAYYRLDIMGSRFWNTFGYVLWPTQTEKLVPILSQ